MRNFNPHRYDHTYLTSRRLFVLLKFISKTYIINTFITKCHIHYSDKDSFSSDFVVDDTIQTLCCCFNCTRYSLRIENKCKGVVSGNLRFNYRESIVDCYKAEFSITQDLLDHSYDFYNNALMILVIKKDSLFTELRHSDFLKKFPSIILSGCGQQDVCTICSLRDCVVI